LNKHARDLPATLIHSLNAQNADTIHFITRLHDTHGCGCASASCFSSAGPTGPTRRGVTLRNLQ
jgi:hypothetical protein